MTELIRIVGVRFKRAGKVYYFNPGDLALAHGDQVVVETATGLAFGDVVVPPKDVPESDVVQPIRNVVRKVGRDDHRQLVANRHDERKAFDIALERIEAHGLPMRLVNAEYTFDRNRLTFFFTADNRVDFRALVHDLARQFGVRIELRQIGVRDEAKEVGGIGVCGRELCCTSWMGEFAPVSIRMAKQQSLSLNPNKLTGQCGRLKCCLKFENDTYREIRGMLPEPGDVVAVGVSPTSLGLENGAASAARANGAAAAAVKRTDSSYVIVQGKVREVLVTWESVDVDIGEGRRVRVSLRQIERGEAVVVTGKLADEALEEAFLTEQAAREAEAKGEDGPAAAEASEPAEAPRRPSNGRSASEGDGRGDAKGSGKGKGRTKGRDGGRPSRRRRRSSRRRPRRRPEEAS